MAKSYDEVRKEALEGETRIINCGRLSREDMTLCLRDMRSAIISEMVLEDFNHFKSTVFFLSRKNYIGRGFSELIHNKHITTLTLGNEFVRGFAFESKYQEQRTISLDALIQMRSLLKLTLHIHNWHSQVFNSLHLYLTNNDCKLDTLVLKGGLNYAGYEPLKTAITGAFSLKKYEGPHQREFQQILDRNLLIKEPQEQEDSARSIDMF